MMRMRSNRNYLLMAMALTTCLSVGPGAKAQAIIREAADFFKFDGTEFFTAATAADPAPPDGALFYRKTVTVAPQSNTLYVSLYATGDSHNGSAEWISCRATPQAGPAPPFCRSSAPGAVDGAPPGWITLLKLPQDVESPAGQNNCNDGGGGSADCHDNAITYQWCVPVRGGTSVTVDLRMATSIAGSDVFIEKGHVYIDSSRITGANQCTQAPDPGTTGSALGAAVTTGEEVARSTKAGQQTH
jgi:hypothetical protein